MRSASAAATRAEPPVDPISLVQRGPLRRVVVHARSEPGEANDVACRGEASEVADLHEQGERAELLDASQTAEPPNGVGVRLAGRDGLDLGVERATLARRVDHREAMATSDAKSALSNCLSRIQRTMSSLQPLPSQYARPRRSSSLVMRCRARRMSSGGSSRARTDGARSPPRALCAPRARQHGEADGAPGRRGGRSSRIGRSLWGSVRARSPRLDTPAASWRYGSYPVAARLHSRRARLRDRAVLGELGHATGGVR
jgi:hypothetical protein